MISPGPDGGQVRRREPVAALEDQPGRPLRRARPLCRANDELDFTFKERRDEEDELSATAMPPALPGEPTCLTCALADEAGLIDEADLRARLASIRSRLEAQ